VDEELLDKLEQLKNEYITGYKENCYIRSDPNDVQMLTRNTDKELGSQSSLRKSNSAQRIEGQRIASS